MWLICNLIACLLLTDPPAKENLPQFQAEQKGQMWVYSGEMMDRSDRPGKKYEHKYAVDVSLLTLTETELILQSSITPIAKETIANASLSISGQLPTASKPAIRVDFIRLSRDKESNQPVKIKAELQSIPATLPFRWDEKSKREALPKIPLEGPAYFEPSPLGLLLSTEWKQQADELWNGSQVYDYFRTEASKDFDDIKAAVVGWRKVERMYISPLDGMPRLIRRKIEHREGNQIIVVSEMSIEMKSPLPPADAVQLRLIRRDAEMAAWLSHEALNGKALAGLKLKAGKYLSETTSTSPYRTTIEHFAK